MRQKYTLYLILVASTLHLAGASNADDFSTSKFKQAISNNDINAIKQEHRALKKLDSIKAQEAVENNLALLELIVKATNKRQFMDLFAAQSPFWKALRNNTLDAIQKRIKELQAQKEEQQKIKQLVDQFNKHIQEFENDPTEYTHKIIVTSQDVRDKDKQAFNNLVHQANFEELIIELMKQNKAPLLHRLIQITSSNENLHSKIDNFLYIPDDLLEEQEKARAAQRDRALAQRLAAGNDHQQDYNNQDDQLQLAQALLKSMADDDDDLALAIALSESEK